MLDSPGAVVLECALFAARSAGPIDNIDDHSRRKTKLWVHIQLKPLTLTRRRRNGT